MIKTHEKSKIGLLNFDGILEIQSDENNIVLQLEKAQSGNMSFQPTYLIEFVLKSEYKLEYNPYEFSLLERFRHLLESKTISEYDEWDMRRNDYKKDIRELDLYISETAREIANLKAENEALKSQIL